jgi:hypothetical protein
MSITSKKEAFLSINSLNLNPLQTGRHFVQKARLQRTGCRRELKSSNHEFEGRKRLVIRNLHLKFLKLQVSNCSQAQREEEEGYELVVASRALA